MNGFFERLGSVSWDEVMAAVMSFLEDPTGEVEAMMVGAVVIVLVLLIVVLIALYLLMPPKRRLVKTRHYTGGAPSAAAPQLEEATEPRPERRKPSRRKDRRKSSSRMLLFLGSGAGTVLIVLVAYAGLYVATSSDSYCIEVCHAGSSSVLAAHEDGHASCVECHERSGFAGFGGNTVSRVRMAVRRIVGQSGAEALPVPSSQCVGCHRDVLEETVVTDGGIAVAHSQILESGEPCMTCHIGSGHTRPAYTLGMSPCVVCHDSVTAPVECDLCHVPQQAQAPAPGVSANELSANGYYYTPVDASKPYCDGCHDVAGECDPCHGGVRMPHDDAFILGGHARPAAFEGKTTCWKCHDPRTECKSPCHGGFDRTGTSGHPEGWKAEHKKAPRTATCGCHQWNSGRQGPMCPVCH